MVENFSNGGKMKIKPKLSPEEIEVITKEKAREAEKAKQHAAWVKAQLDILYNDGYKFFDFPDQRATVCYQIQEHNVVRFSVALLNPQDKWNKNEGRYQAWNHMDFGNCTKIKIKNNHPRKIKTCFYYLLSAATDKYTQNW